MRHAEQRSDNRRFGGYPFQLSLRGRYRIDPTSRANRSEEHTSELQSHLNLVCRLLLEKKKNTQHIDAGVAVEQSHGIAVRLMEFDEGPDEKSVSNGDSNTVRIRVYSFRKAGDCMMPGG